MSPGNSLKQRPVYWLLFLMSISSSLTARNPLNYSVLAPTPQDQEITVTGKVTDGESLESLPGVSVSLKSDSRIGTITNESGEYTIRVPADAILVYSFIGFEKTEIRVGNQSRIDVSLKFNIATLQEVVVVGYGEQKKISVTGSVATVNMSYMKTPVRSLSNALAGKVAGVISVASGGGEPGYDNPTFTIRGIGTFRGSVSPLIIVDGVQREDVNSTYGGAFNNIDPEDIASISLLKDASATAVYGAKGANGVLIITTKRGTAGKPKISMKMEYGLSGLTKLPTMLDGVNYMKLYNEAQLNDPSHLGPVTYSDEVIAKSESGLDPLLYPDVNWIDRIYKDWAPTYNANVNVSGGQESMRYYMSMSFYDQDGQYKVRELDGYNPNLNFKRYDFRSNIDVDLSKNTLLSLNIAAMLVNSRYPGNSAANIWYATYATNPISFPIQYENNRWAGPRNNGGSNPFNLVQNSGYSSEFKPAMQSVMTLTQKLDNITKGLSAIGRFSFDSYSEFNTRRPGINDLWYAGSRNPDGSLVYERVRTGSTSLGYGSSSSGERVMYLEADLNYIRSFDKHEVGGLFVYNMRNRVIGTAGELKYAIPFRMQNLAGRITYSYADKYLAEVNMGATGSENFARGHRWGYFPAASVGWVVSNEEFFKNLANTFTLLKVRASRGLTGNDQIGGDRFGYLTYIEGGGGVAFGLGPTYYGGIRESVIGTENLTWEKSTKDNVGIELGLFDRINIVVDVFKDKREQILIPRESISPVAGYTGSVIFANMGEMENKGIDGSVEYTANFGSETVLRAFGNFTYARNKIVFADQPERVNAYQQWEGHRYGEFTGYVSQGLFVDQADVDASPRQFRDVYPGDIQYADLNNDADVNGSDWTFLDKSSFPTVSYGFGFTFGHKRFEISSLFQGIADVGIMANGSYITSGDGAASGVGVVPFTGIGQYPGSVLSNINSRWTVDNPSQNVDYPRLTIANTSDNNYINSTWWLKDGSFCRLKQVTVAYTLPPAVSTNARMESLQVYASGTNLLTFSKFDLWDPELGSNGAKYPYARTFMVGIRAQF